MRSQIQQKFQIPVLCLFVVISLLAASQLTAAVPLKSVRERTPAPAKPVTKTSPVKTSDVLFVPPAADKQPKQTVGAGSRLGDACQQPLPILQSRAERAHKPPFMALVPLSNSGLTVAPRPTIWVYLPQTTAKRLVLSLWPKGSARRRQTSLEIPTTAGVIGLPFPSGMPDLKIGKTYEWAAVLICGDQPSPNDPIIVSSISRVAARMPIVSSPLERAASYGRSGIWFDALAALALARRLQPNRSEPTIAWNNFLRSAGLDIVALEPLRS